MVHNPITLFAQTNFRNQCQQFGIKPKDRRQHFYVVGKTGTGKTTLLKNMAVQDIKACQGNGVGIIDPHGQLAEEVFEFIPSYRTNEVIYFNPADTDWPIGFNILEKVEPEKRPLVSSGVVAVFKKIWADSWGPRLEYVLRNSIMALLETPGSTLLGIMKMLANERYRQQVVSQVTDPVVKDFWIEEFAKYPDRFMAEAVAPIQNKVGQFLTSPLIRNIVGQTKSTIDLREVMDTGKILVVNLCKGKIGEDSSALLGSLLITGLQLAALSRANLPEDERRDFYLYVDEFQSFATESFATILSEARKYRLNLILAHQYIAQLPETVKDAVFGNVGTMVTFRVGADDAQYLAKEFNPTFTMYDLVNLGFAEIYLKLMIDNLTSHPFSATTLPPIKNNHQSRVEKIINASRQRYGRPKIKVEKKIAYQLNH